MSIVVKHNAVTEAPIPITREVDDMIVVQYFHTQKIPY